MWSLLILLRIFCFNSRFPYDPVSILMMVLISLTTAVVPEVDILSVPSLRCQFLHDLHGDEPSLLISAVREATQSICHGIIRQPLRPVFIKPSSVYDWWISSLASCLLMYPFGFTAFGTFSRQSGLRSLPPSRIHSLCSPNKPLRRWFAT